MVLNFIFFCCCFLYRYFRYFAKRVVQNKIFQLSILLVIILNSLVYSLINNRSNSYLLYVDYLIFSRNFFFIFYLIEMLFKMAAYGLWFHENSYFRDGWNYLDFFVIVFLMIMRLDVNFNFDVSLLRMLRLLIPLKTTNQFLELQMILSVLFSSLPSLFIACLILLYCYLFFSIAGLQMFSGILKNRCILEQTGMELIKIFGNHQDYEPVLCGNYICPEGYLCVKLIKSAYEDVISYDNIFFSLLQTLFIVTMDNWSNIMYNVLRTLNNYFWIYFILLIIIGNYILMNLTLAVIKVKFSELHQTLINHLSLERKDSQVKTYLELNELKKDGRWIDRGNRRTLEKRRNTISISFIKLNLDLLRKENECERTLHLLDFFSNQIFIPICNKSHLSQKEEEKNSQI